MSDLKTQTRNSYEAKTRKNFSKVVWIYDLWSNLTEKKALSEALALANITPGETVLDVASSLLKMLLLTCCLIIICWICCLKRISVLYLMNFTGYLSQTEEW